MRTVRRKMLTTSLKYNSRRPHEKPKKGLAGRFCSTEGCIFGVLALWLQKPLQWDFVSVRKKEKKNYTSQQVRLYTSPADILKHTWPLLSSQPPRWKESEWSCIPAESLASSDLSYCVNTGHTASERPAIEVNLHWKHSVLRDWFFFVVNYTWPIDWQVSRDDFTCESVPNYIKSTSAKSSKLDVLKL